MYAVNFSQFLGCTHLATAVQIVGCCLFLFLSVAAGLQWNEGGAIQSICFETRDKRMV